MTQMQLHHIGVFVKFVDGRAYNHEPDQNELLVHNLAVPSTSTVARKGDNCAEGI